MSNCCIGLCVKDSEEGLVQVLNNVDRIKDLFLDTKIIVAYDKSDDASLKILTDYSLSSGNMVIMDVENRNDYRDKHERHVDRSERIANARNMILDYIYNHYASYEYFVMMDTNRYSCVTPIDTKVLARVVKSNEWDGLSFNRDPYYDIWALSIPP